MTFHELVATVAASLAAAELREHPLPERDFPALARRTVRLAEQIVVKVLELTPPP